MAFLNKFKHKKPPTDQAQPEDEDINWASSDWGEPVGKAEEDPPPRSDTPSSDDGGLRETKEVKGLAFLRKLFTKKGSAEDSDTDDESQEWSSAPAWTAPADGDELDDFHREDDEDHAQGDTAEDTDAEPGIARFRLNTVKLADEDEETEEEEEEEGEEKEVSKPVARPAQAKAGEDEDEEDSGVSFAGMGSSDDTDGDGGGIEDPNSMANMMGIFEEEATVDQTLLTLTSWVEDVDAEELVHELRSLMEELKGSE